MQSLKAFSIYTKKVLSIKDSYAIKSNAAAMGFDEKLLVENAGNAIAAALGRTHRRKKILFVCGTGGKAAIGMCAARRLLETPDIDVTVALIGSESQIHNPVTKFNYDILSEMTPIKEFTEANINDLKSYTKRADVLIEALIGIGLKGKIYGVLARAIKIINEAGKHITSIDTPAGIDGDTGMPNTASIKADHVLTLHKFKLGIEKSHLISSTTIEKIGVPLSAELVTGPGDLMLAMEHRAIDADKYSHGSVLVLGGSPEFKTAPLLASYAVNAAVAGLRLGAGYATLVHPKGITETFDEQSINLSIRSLKGKTLSSEDLPLIESIKHNTLVIGEGMANAETSYKPIASLVKRERDRGNIVVVDALAIRALSKNKGIFGKNSILTPHYGEFKALSGIDLSSASLESKINTAINFAKNYNCILALKGHETIITDGDLLKINESKTPALATMGTGDVLAGIIAGFASSHRNAFESAAAAVYLHSKIADLLYIENGNHILATDVIGAIPKVLKTYDSMKLG
jgi:NAD(P)H-hydrate epimerase